MLYEKWVYAQQAMQGAPSIQSAMHMSTCCRPDVSPGLLRAQSCRAYRQAAWGVKAPETATKVLLASDDGGASWQHIGSPGPMHWPTIFQCASGVARTQSASHVLEMSSARALYDAGAAPASCRGHVKQQP